MTMVVKPGTALLPLAKGMVQVGTSPGHSFTLSNLSPADETWLTTLLELQPKLRTPPEKVPTQKVGTVPPDHRTHPLKGLSAQRKRIWNLLREYDLLNFSSATPPLQDLRVRLVGLDRVGIPLARLLFASKIRYLDMRDNRVIDEEVEYLFATDTKGLSRRETLQAAMRGPETFLSRQADPHLVISVENRVIHHQRAGLLLSHEISQLPIIVDDRSIQVGPFCIPSASACYLCQDFHHTDEVPDWPRHRERLRRTPAPLPSPAMATTAAALAVQQIEAIMAPASPRATSQRATSDWYRGLAWRIFEGGIEELRWLPHPQCNCQAI